MANETDLASPLLAEPKKIFPPEYSDDEKKYFANVIKKIAIARDERDQRHDEFDGMTYLQYIENNRKGANTYIEPKKTKTDTNYSSGTIRNKIFIYLSAVMALDLGVDVQTFDQDNHEIRELGEAMENIIFEVGERDGEGGDEEKKLLRFYTMFEQGTVFVREFYGSRFRPKKKLSGNFNGKLDSVTWTKQMKKVWEGCSRQIILNENVILGNMREYEMAKQPFVVDIDVIPYEDAEAIYGTWDRFKNVPCELSDVLNVNRDAAKLYSPFRLYTTPNAKMVEVVRYQNLNDNERMIFLNGVMMNPIGFPMEGDEYDIAKQNLQVISAHFAIGKSMVMLLRNNTMLLDEMIRLAIKKTQKSFAPPMLNTTGKQLSQRVFAPGTITAGIKEGTLTPLDPSARAVEGGEFNMIEFLQNKIDEKTVNPTFGGQQPSGTPTATQVLEVQRQAKMVISLTVLVCSLLEYKLGWLRLHSILKNWFVPEKRIYDQYSGEFITKYKSVVRDQLIEGYGMGQQIVKVMDKNQTPTVEEQMDQEDALSTPTKPVRITYIDPDFVTSSKLVWYINVVSKEKKSDALNKVLFNEFSTGAMQFPDVNMRHLEERYAEVWEENPAKLFPKQPDQTTPGTQTQTQGTPGPATSQMQTPQNMPPKMGSRPSNQAGIPQTPTPQRNKSTILQMAGKQL